MHDTHDVHDKLSSDEKIVNNEKSQKVWNQNARKLRKCGLILRNFVDKFEFLVQFEVCLIPQN